jgi:ABC-type Fe3+/spermidine/putrescine transport system ATPase subunit
LVKVELRGVTKRFGDVLAAGDVSLQIEDGEFFTFLGPSGCGKTTTMRMIAGLEYPDEGEVFFDGEDVTNLPSFRRNTGMVFQNYALWPHMKVFENVAYGLRVRKVEQAELKKRVNDALELVHLGGLGDRFPSQLSGGQQQRVALARVMVINPSVLLLDEPLSNLDAKLRVEMREEIKDLQKELGITTIYVTHDQEEAMAVSDRVAIQNHGVIRQVGSPSDIYSYPRDVFIATFIGRGAILEGVASLSDGGPQVNLGGFTVEGVDSTSTVGDGDRVACVMRPESFSVSEPGEPSNRLEGVVEWSSFIGPYKEVKLNVGGTTLLVDVPPETEAAVGGTLRVYIPVRRTIVLPWDEVD